MKKYTIERTDNTDLTFDGDLLKETSSSADQDISYYSGSTGRWTTLGLYWTKGGKLIKKLKSAQIRCMP